MDNPVWFKNVSVFSLVLASPPGMITAPFSRRPVLHFAQRENMFQSTGKHLGVR
jgi:hypothetical protein